MKVYLTTSTLREHLECAFEDHLVKRGHAQFDRPPRAAGKVKRSIMQGLLVHARTPPCVGDGSVEEKVHGELAARSACDQHEKFYFVRFASFQGQLLDW